MRILLVKPKARLGPIRGLQRFQRLEPIELGYLAASVPPGHEIRVADLRLARFADLAFRRELARFRPDLVALTGYTHEGSIVRQLTRVVRAKLPGANVVVGGLHATVAPEDYNVESIDAIVRGEGCVPFREIINALAAGRDLLGISGVLVPGRDYDERGARGFPPFPDPAILPTPRRDLWDYRDYTCVWVAENQQARTLLFPPASTVRTSFGCRMNCSFCIVPMLYGGQHRPRPVNSVVDEIASLPTEHVYFCDDENFIDEDFAFELAAALEARGVKKRYFAWTRSTTVNRQPELFRRWREIGLDAAFLGFEFPSDEKLKKVKKGATVADNDRAHVKLRELGIAVHAGFMLMPESSYEDFESLHQYVNAMPPAQCSFTVCTPSPGTAAYDEMKPKIWVENPHDLHDCMHPLTPTKLPLRKFCKLYARQLWDSNAKNPLRVQNLSIPVRELVRVSNATIRTYRAYHDIYKDYPRELWD